MGFYTTFHLAYPSDPGAVTGTSLRTIVEKITPLCRPEGSWCSLSVKFGKSPGLSNRPFFWFIPTAFAGSAVVGISQSDWDVEVNPKTSDELLSYLRSISGKGIHRALCNFGAVTDEILARLKREPGPENEIGLEPYDVGLDVGPIEVEPDNDDEDLV